MSYFYNRHNILIKRKELVYEMWILVVQWEPFDNTYISEKAWEHTSFPVIKTITSLVFTSKLII